MHPFLYNGQNGHFTKQIVIIPHELLVIFPNVHLIVTHLPIDLSANFLINAPLP